jgi:hypothetical protein
LQNRYSLSTLLVTYDFSCLRSLTDIATSAGLWASVATLWGAAGIWFTYFSEAQTRRKEEHDRIQNLLAGICAELDVANAWAAGDENNKGYLQSKTIEQLTHENGDWFYPTRLIFTFHTPTIHGITTSPFAHDLSQVLPSIVKLSYSIRRLFEANADLRSFANQSPFYASVMKKLAQLNNVYTEQEREFMNILFAKNRTIHQELIGGADSSDDTCLYKSYRLAQKAISDFEKQFKPKSFPWWYAFLHAAAIVFIILGFLQLVEWSRAVGFWHLF